MELLEWKKCKHYVNDVNIHDRIPTAEEEINKRLSNIFFGCQ